MLRTRQYCVDIPKTAVIEIDRMPEYVKRYSPLFFNSADEELFTKRLRVLIPDVVYIDGQLWQSPQPPVQNTLSECQSPLVYIWSPTACSRLPVTPLPNGRFRGPSSGLVVQLCRCSIVDGVLISGDIGIAYDKNDSRIVEFVDRVWNTVKASNASKLSSINPVNRQVIKGKISDYVVGQGAAELSNSGVLLKHSDANVYYAACKS